MTDYVPLGNSGLKVSRFALGTLTAGNDPQFAQMAGLDADDYRRLFDIAFDHGVNLVDTANMYSFGQAEEITAQALEGRRDDIVLTSKVRMPLGDGPNDGGASRQHILREVENSLRRLRTDHLDLLYTHQWDGVTPVEETLAALDTLVRDGKVRYLGTSNYSAWQLSKTVYTARALGLTAPVVQQMYYTPEAREIEYEILPAARDLGIGTFVWSPLGEGLLTGKVRRGQETPRTTRQGTDWPEPHVTDWSRAYDIIDAFDGIARERGVSVPRVVLAWLLGRPGITGIVLGARTEDQLRDNLAAAELELSEEERDTLTRVSQLPAYYPWWHRVLNASDRPDPAEEPYLTEFRAYMPGGGDSAS
ncbi:aldo/keto reductase [Streptomyces sp. Ru73]|uniref:aldo/keto reductase n=1 Tax=Streptomyces sp. Ru73 TaxID=2080748 RepID=UPI000CDD9707|nr:aldo/keto reductase [Streptomyces sp. Ru73]POX43415.1 aldo/keto reductase [Streptomyces sp. Ru73]